MSSTTAGSDRPLAGKSAVVTGASRGIGLECARRLHADGARVLLLARGADTVGQAAREVGASASGVQCDMASPESVARALAEIRETLGAPPDIVVNNAGAFSLATVEQTALEDFERMVRVNLVAPFAFVRDFLGDMKRRGSGHLVTIGSVADRHAFPENAAYAASKFGARGLHEVLRAELRGSGVRATLVSPGPTDTALWDPVNPDQRPGFTKRADMLSASAVGDAVRWVVTRPLDCNVDELRLSRA